MIAPSEYQLAIMAALDEAVALSRDDLIVETARMFGFDRTGTELKQEIDRQIQELIRTASISDDGKSLRGRRAELIPTRLSASEPRIIH